MYTRYTSVIQVHTMRHECLILRKSYIFKDNESLVESKVIAREELLFRQKRIIYYTLGSEATVRACCLGIVCDVMKLQNLT